MKSKLNPIVVAAVGVALCLLAVGLVTYFLILPVRSAIGTAQARIDAAAPDATPQAQLGAKKDLEKAVADVGVIQGQWRTIENTLMPPFDVSQRYVAWNQLASELALNLGPSVQRWIPRTGVVPLTDISIAPPPANPNAITAAPLIVPIGSGTVSVGGSFRGILSHVQQWNNFNRLVLVDNLQLHGNSPYMEGTYNASVIIFPQNDAQVAQPLANATAGQ